MENLNNYLNAIKDKVRKSGFHKDSKVEKEIITIVNEMVSKKEPATISAVTQRLGKVKNYG